MKKHLCMQCMLETDERETLCPYCGYPVSSKQPKPYLPQGTVLNDRYLVGKMIKRNVDSAVYIGYDNSLDKAVEIREFFPQKLAVRGEDEISVSAQSEYASVYDEYLQSFIQLWKNLMRFKGLPALFEVSEIFESGGTAYAVTDHNDSTTFGKILNTMDVERNPFSLKRTQTLILAILSTVESLHTANVVHRGISPDTIVLSSDGVLKITGFAIPQVRTTKNKLLSNVCDGYAAIEQYDFNWQQGSWTDVYSIGALLYKMLTGRTLPPAPSRLNDEEVFFTDEEKERIPQNIIELIKDCLVLMPQGRMKDIHDIVNVFSPKETSKKTVTAVRNRFALNQEQTAEAKQKREIAPTVRPAHAIISESEKQKEREREEASRPKEIVKPKQAEAVTKTTLSKTPSVSYEQKLREAQEAEADRKMREELYLKQKAEHEAARRADEKRRKELEEQLKEKKRIQRREALGKSAAGRAVNNASERVAQKLRERRLKKVNPVKIAAFVGMLVTVFCVFLTVLLYGTVLYKYVDSPVLDNALSRFTALPVNSGREVTDDVQYVKVVDFKTLTKEYIENDSLYNRRFDIVYEYDWCDTVEPGYVFSQSIEPDEKVPVGSTITVYISKGIQMLQFINVVGRQYDEACNELTSLGFVVSKEEAYNIGIHRENEVSAASLTVGEEYPKGTEVRLTVWSAPPVTLPSFTQPQGGDNNDDNNNRPGADGGFFDFWRDILGF